MQYVKQGMPYLSYGNLWYLHRTAMCNVVHFPFTVNVYQLKWTACLPWITNHEASSAWKITDWSVQVYWMLLNYTRVSGTAATESSPVQLVPHFILQTQLLAEPVYVKSYGGGLITWTTLKWKNFQASKTRTCTEKLAAALCEWLSPQW